GARRLTCPGARMQPGDVVAERFEIERLAGTGGMGAVFRARDRETGEPVAVKVVRGADPVRSARFAREATVIAELQHPGIVRYVAHGATQEHEPFLAMEWVEGTNLADRLAEQGLSMAESVALMAGIAKAVGFAHRRGVVHRDLKPSNVMLASGSL